jgi:hypothetical protein
MNEQQQDAIVEVFEAAGFGIVFENLVFSTDSVESFVTQWGTPDAVCGAVHVWDRVQTRPGKVGGDLAVLAVDGGTLTYFGGES